ncbi:flagellar basal-body MS-ring/collar protein FliF [Paenibacillus chitinolyticus]|uniref:flagellar basal-body MS-ring/collar protein FliF n=1 Tax=Paenibacillus chitinolyticus TaxID=79263 RepID=UPI002DB98323|nr:flagellar basal-body MS-ring/collar protein FliF [Paenibacillus chitinolyticus]MEC0244767.1 flagellar basal-body MS-ring/collar protein FliF [Paenibacillus chitinolyticus]
MNERLLQYWEKAKQYWNQYSKTTKLTFVAALFVLLLTIGIISYNLAKTEYSLAYTNLQPADAAAIKGYLDTAKIPYNLSSDGKSIEVPKNEVANVKLGIESQGLNKGSSIGYDAFASDSAFGMTDNEFKVKYLSAVQGELQQLINSNEAVDKSKVLISMPDETVFLANQKQEATASVVLNVKQGYSLDQGQVDTIYNLVSHSVKNLPLQNITISDQYGQFLAYSKETNGGQSTSGLVQNQFDIRRKFETSVQGNITNLLNKMLGPDKVVVSVFSTMNFDQKKTTENLVTPPNVEDKKGLEISTQESSKTSTSTGGNTGGVAGTGQTDVPGYPGGAASGNANSEESSKTVNYEINRITNDIIQTPYVVKDISINIGFDSTGKDQAAVAELKGLIEGQMANIVRASLADNKVEYTAAQIQDKVKVVPQTFVTPSGIAGTNWQQYLLYGGIGLAALLLGALGMYAIRRKKKAGEEEEELDLPPAKVEYPTIDIENVSNENQVRKQLETLAKKKPDEFVNLLRTWLVDE